jgi:hypothetical protein
VRASYATAFREPSILDMFQGQVEGFPFGEDPCDHAFGISPRTLMGEVLAKQADSIVATFTPEAQESIRRAQEGLRPQRDQGEEPGKANPGA